MKNIFIALLFLFSFLSGAPAVAEMEVFFSPETNLREILLKEIETLSETLDLALHGFTSPDFVQALISAKERGVKIRIVTDSRQARMKSSLISLLIKQGITVKTLSGGDKGSMNHRFAILDGKKVITGSHDWREGPAKGDYESILILQDNDLTDSYQKEFDRLWREKRMIK